MSRKLDDFQAEVHLDGWFIREAKGSKSFRAGQKFKGSEITPRMVEALEEPVDTWRDAKTGKLHPVMTLVGGDLEDLKEMLAAADEPEKAEAPPKKKAAPKKAAADDDEKEEPKRHPRSKK